MTIARAAKKYTETLVKNKHKDIIMETQAKMKKNLNKRLEEFKNSFKTEIFAMHSERKELTLCSLFSTQPTIL
jgi:hypothetical protein